MKEFWCNCVNFDGDVNELSNMIDEGIEINANDFFNQCFVDDDIKQMFAEYPNDFMFYCSENDDIYWFTHSAIEYFYREE